MERKEVNLKNIKIEGARMERIDGDFEAPDGRKVKWYGYRLKLQMNGVVYKFKLDKAFNETMEDMLSDVAEEDED